MSVNSTLLKVSLDLNDYEYDSDGVDKYLETVQKYRKLNNSKVFSDTKIHYKLNDKQRLEASATDSNYDSKDKNGKIAVDIATIKKSGLKSLEIPDNNMWMEHDISGIGIYTPLLDSSDWSEVLKTKEIVYRFNNRRVYEINQDFKRLIKRSRSTMSKIKCLSKDQVMECLKDLARQTLGQEGFFSQSKSRFNSFIDTVKKLLPGEVTDSSDTSLKPPSVGVGVIVRVVEFNNTRIAAMATKDMNRNSEYKCYTCTPSSEKYNYLDVGRKAIVFVTERGGSYHNYRQQTNRFCRGIFHDMDVDIPDDENLLPAIYEEYGSKNFEVIDTDDFKATVQKVKFNRQSQAKKQKKESTLKDKISEKIKYLKDDEGKTIKLNEVTYTSEEIDYEGQKLKRTDGPKNWVYKLMRNALSVHKIDDITFDTILNTFIKSLDVDYSGTEMTAVIGEVDVTRSWKRIEHKNGNVQVLHYINGSRINKDEVSAVLERALCYNDNDNYNAFLKEVSKCSLRFHRYLHTGIDLRVRDNLNRTTAYKIKLPLERRSNVNYLDINDELYRVSDTNRLLDNAGTISLSKFSDLLIESGAVQDVELKDIVPILKEGKQTYEDAVAKSKKLVESTEKLFDLSAQTHTFQDESTKKGYLIEGKLRSYVVEYDPDLDVNEQSHGVYSYPEGRYICIVDKSTDQAGYDKLINRVYALHNDNLVASKISTL